MHTSYFRQVGALLLVFAMWLSAVAVLPANSFAQTTDDTKKDDKKDNKTKTDDKKQTTPAAKNGLGANEDPSMIGKRNINSGTDKFFGWLGGSKEKEAALGRQLAMEVGKHGIRVICIRSAGSPDAPGVDEVFNLHAQHAGITREAFEAGFAERTMLKRLPKLNEVANTAVLMASDKASAITAAVVNATCGELAD